MVPCKPYREVYHLFFPVTPPHDNILVNYTKYFLSLSYFPSCIFPTILFLVQIRLSQDGLIFAPHDPTIMASVTPCTRYCSQELYLCGSSRASRQVMLTRDALEAMSSLGIWVPTVCVGNLGNHLGIPHY